MKKVIAYNASRITMALSNYMPGCMEGYAEAKNEFLRVVRTCKSAEQACKELNNHRWTVDRFSPFSVLPNGFILRAVDCYGNVSMIKITEC